MDAFDAIATKLEVREYDSKKPVPKDVKMKVLEAARLTASGMNSQHWRLILVQDPKNVKQLADDSTTGQWVAQCNFAVIVLTSPQAYLHQLDAGRAIQDMQYRSLELWCGIQNLQRFQPGANEEGFCHSRQYGAYRHRGIRLSIKENHREEKSQASRRDRIS